MASIQQIKKKKRVKLQQQHNPLTKRTLWTWWPDRKGHTHTGRPPHLNSPEVTWQQEYDGDHRGDETGTKDVAQQVDQDGARSEEEVEEWSQRVPDMTDFSSEFTNDFMVPLFVVQNLACHD